MVLPGETVCLVGRNGSGKSTLLKIAAGLVDSEEGDRFVRPGTTIRYLPQEPDLAGYVDTLSYVQGGVELGDDPHRPTYLLNQLGLTGTEIPSNLSGGEARRAALARILAPRPDILLLDEPTNHLDLPTIEWLEKELRDLRRALVIVSHDRRFLERLSQATVWLDRGQTRRLSKGFTKFEEWRDGIIDNEDRTQKKLGRKILREEHWLRYGVTARRKRNIRRLENLHNLRLERRDNRKRIGNVKFERAEAEVSSKLVIEAKAVSMAFGDAIIADNFSIRIKRGDRLGIIGTNGAGKTTLLKILSGVLKPDAGRVRMGTFLEIATMDQARESLNPDWTVRQALTDDTGDYVNVQGVDRHVIGYMKDFLFTPDMADTPIAVMSGGERGRLMLARALARKSNVLILDEPTNDLDLETLDLLQEALSKYEGTMILVTHDRDFLDRVVTSVVVAEGQGRWIEYAGGYTDMISQRGADIEAQLSVRKSKVASSNQKNRQTVKDKKQKLSFKEKYALEMLPGEIDTLQAEIRRLRVLLENPNLYIEDPQVYNVALLDLQEAEARLAVAERDWLELEILRESIEQSG